MSSRSSTLFIALTMATSVAASAMPLTSLNVPAAAPAFGMNVCAPETEGAAAAEAAILAACAGLRLANGDVDGATAAALDATARAYGDETLPPRVLEIYAHQYAFLQNPVLDPGFLLDETAPHPDAQARVWQGDHSIIDGTLVVSGSGETASQSFGVAQSGNELETGDLSASPYWGPDTLSVDYMGAGTITVTLVLANADTWEIPVSLPERAQMTNARIDLLATIGPDTPVTGGPFPVTAADALPASALLRLDVESSDRLAIDNVVLDGVAYGAEPRAAIELDAANFLSDAVGRLAPDLTSGFSYAHDGYSTVILPLEYVPAIVNADPLALVDNVEAFALAGEWTFFVGLVEHTPSGPAFVTPSSLKLKTGRTATGWITEFAPLADQGDAGAAFAGLFAAQGLTDVVGAVATITILDPADLARLFATIKVDAPRYDGAERADGFFNHAKLAAPGHAMNDLQDLVPQSLYVARESLAGATYASERRWDTNDGFVGALRPHGAVPVEDGLAADSLLLPNAEGDYVFDLSFQDYSGERVLGQYTFVAFFGAEGFVAAQEAIAAGDPEWFELAEFTACDVQPSFLECEELITKGNDDYELAIPAKLLHELEEGQGLGGEAFAIAFLHVPGAPVDQELLGTVPARAAFNPVVNALLDVADDFGVSVGGAKVGPYWIYAAADAQSMLGAPLQFAPASDMLDGYAVLIQPVRADSGGVLTPSIDGDYEFDVRFRAYADGIALRDEARLPIDYLGFHLTDAQSQANGGLWSRRASPDGGAVQGDASYRVRVPAYEIELQAAAETQWLQSLTAWASTWHPDYAASGDVRRDWLADDDGQLIGGFYNAQKNALAANALADQLDNVPGSFLLDRGAEQYGVLVTALTPAANVDRSSTTRLQYEIVNTGTFRETFTLTLSESEDDLDAAFANGGDTVSVTLLPGSAAIVDVLADVRDAADNDEAMVLDVTATLPHAVSPGVEMPAVVASTTLTVAPLLFDVVNNGPVELDLVPGAPGSFGFVVRNLGGVVTESFDLSATASDALGAPVVAPGVTGPLSPGGSAQATASFTVDPTAVYGSSATVQLHATPSHEGAPATAAATVHVPDSTLTLTPIVGDVVQLRPGDAVELTFLATYAAPAEYSETFDLAAKHNILTAVATTLRVDGIETSQATFDGPGTKIIALEFTVPPTTAFGTVDETTLWVNTTNTPQSDASAQATGLATVATATLTSVAPGLQLGLQGETLTWTIPFTYAGDVAWAFDLAVADVPGLEDVTLSPDDLSFAAEGGTATVTVTAKLADTLAYATAASLNLDVTSVTAPWTGTSALPSTPLSARVFSVQAPSITTDDSGQSTFPRDVAVDVAFELLFDLPSDERTAWDERDQGIVHELAVEHTTADWLDTHDAQVTLARGVAAQVMVRAMPQGVAAGADDVLTLRATATGLPKPVDAGDGTSAIEIYGAEDLVVHTMLAGCYGDAADACDRVVSPVQAIATHDLPATPYSRAWLVMAPILVHDADAPTYVRYTPGNPDPAASGITAGATVTSLGVDAGSPLEATRVLAAPALEDDERFQTLALGAHFLAFPESPGVGPGLTPRSGVTALLWETGGDASDTEWFLQRLGSLQIDVTMDVHGIELTSTFAPERALLPLLGDHTVPGPATIVPDKDDQDGDGYAAVAELRSNSNPVLYSSTPYTDEDDDGYVNARDLIGFVHEECLMKDVNDVDWIPCPEAAETIGLPVQPQPPTAAMAFGPTELTYYVERIVSAYSIGGPQ